MWFNNTINRRNENMNGYENIDRSIVFCHTERRRKDVEWISETSFSEDDK